MAGWFYADIDTSDIARTIGDIKKYSGKTLLRIEEALDISAKAVTKQAKANAPRGRTGLLKKNFRSQLTGRNKQRLEAWSYVRGGRFGAPHAHLVENGAKAVTIRAKGTDNGGKQAMTVDSWGVRRYVGGGIKIPARTGKPFFKPAYEAELPRILQRIRQAIHPDKTVR